MLPDVFASGAAHILFPDGGDGVPDSLDGVPAVWLGTIVDDEGDGQASIAAMVMT